MEQKNNLFSETRYPLRSTRFGFTLIEILIVVAIIAILASVVLIGLGPTQQSGRDAKRLSDLREVQTGLELFYAKCGFYPGSYSGGACVNQPTTGSGWTDLTAALTSAPIGVTQVPNDPSGGTATYYYSQEGNGSSYVLGAMMENSAGSAFQGYNYPSSGPFPGGLTNCVAPYYCLSL